MVIEPHQRLDHSARGGGLTLPALAMLGMSAATPADAGLVSGLFNTTQ